MQKKLLIFFLIVMTVATININLVFAANVDISLVRLDSAGALINVKSDDKIVKVVMYMQDPNGEFIRFFENSEDGYNEKNFFISPYRLSEKNKTNLKVEVTNEKGETKTDVLEIGTISVTPSPSVSPTVSPTSVSTVTPSVTPTTINEVDNSSSLNLYENGVPTSSPTNGADNIKPTSISLSQKNLTLTIGKNKSSKLNLTISPSNAQTKLTWSTSNKNVATVDSNGVVTGKKTGTAIIKVRTANGLIAQCNVTVKVKKISATISKSNSSSLLKVNAVNKCTAAQSLTITDKYYVFNKIRNSANTVRNASDNCAIYVYDKNTKKRVNTLIGDFGHSNGATYVAKDNSIYICHMADRKITKISADNLTSKTLKRSVIKFPVETTAIEYDSYTNQWILRNSNKISIYSSDLKKLKRTFTVPCHIHQDCASYKGLLLSIDFVKPSQAYIYVYNINTKECYGRYKVTIPNELESIGYDEKNDRFIMLFNDSVGDTVYATKAINLKKYY